MKLFVTGAIAAAIMSMSAAQASAATLTPGFDPEFDGEVSVRFRSFGNTGGEEVYLGEPNLGDPANRNAAQFTWAPGAYDFEFVVDLDNDLLSATLDGGTPLTYSYTGTPTINALQVTVADRDGSGELWLTDLVVNGTALGAVTVETDEGFQDFMVSGLTAGLSEYTITGVINVSGSFGTSQELSRIEIRAGSLPNPIPLPAAGWMLIAGVGGLVALKRRRKAA
jgi:hypothetical protein